MQLLNDEKNVELHRKIKFSKSIVFRVTLWYSIFIILLLVGMMFVMVGITNKSINEENKKELKQEVEEAAYEPERHKKFDDGVYYSFYKDGKIVEDNLPNGFDKTIPLNDGIISTYKAKNKTYYYYDMFLKNGDSRWVRGVMVVDDKNEAIDKIIYTMLIISPVIFFVIIFGGYYILKKAFNPVKKIMKTAIDIEEGGDFSKRIEVSKKEDEFRMLALTFNEMLSSIEETFIREKQFNNDVSHELRTPVSVILAESEYGMKYLEDVEEAKGSCEVINRQALRMKQMIKQIMDFARLNKHIELSSIDLSSIIRRKEEEFEKIAKTKNVNLTFDIDKSCVILGEELLLERLLDNLITNAFKFTKDSIEIVLRKEKKIATLSIKDNGIGIEKKLQDRIWDRFYQVDASRNKDTKEGSGLGLSLVKKIIEIHKATIRIESEENEGANFIMEFNLQ